MTTIGQIAHLKELLLGMERDLGMDDLGLVEKNIVYAASILSEKCDNFESDEIRRHALLQGVSRSTFFRALKYVVAAGYLNHFQETQRSTYTLARKLG